MDVRLKQARKPRAQRDLAVPLAGALAQNRRSLRTVARGLFGEKLGLRLGRQMSETFDPAIGIIKRRAGIGGRHGPGRHHVLYFAPSPAYCGGVGGSRGDD